MLNEMNDTEYLVQALLAELKEEDFEQCQSETSYDWDNLPDVEEKENYVEANHVLPSYIETVSRDERIKELTALFEKEFSVGKLFSDKADARTYIQKISRANNIPFETVRSDAKYVKMGCKHFGSYRVGKKVEEGNVA
ncbi:hypothetical protein HPULCUR_010609 [Helicostylum pulchrum]|uniref:Uncharacterized protein n=1 Tax=Helicostylum pulchrum TaxID=562976 RepID=A0ABP9YDQ8_9FUNG